MKANVRRGVAGIADAGASAALVLVGAALAATALYFVIARDAYVVGPLRALVFVILPGALGLGAFVAAPSRLRRPLAVAAIVVVGAAYGAEIALSAANWRAWNRVLERSDPRSKLEVLEAFRAAGQEAWAVASPASLAGALHGGLGETARELLPLGGIPGVVSVYCGEGRPFVVYHSDRFGFFNPAAAYAERPRVLLLGDSYVHGYCVGPQEGIAPRLRERFPGALNFGMNGNGPLMELATLREYGPMLEPEFVVWTFFAGNDFEDLEYEKQRPALAAYLDPRHRQGLGTRSDQVAALLRRRVEAARSRASRTPLADTEGVRLSLSRKLMPVLSMHNLLPFLGLPYGRVDFDYALLEQILTNARTEVASWGGRLVFAYLPLTSDFYGLSRFTSDRGIARQRTLAIARKAGLPVVDLHAAIASLPDPMAVSETPRTHYDAMGYELVAREIAAALRGLGEPTIRSTRR